MIRGYAAADGRLRLVDDPLDQIGEVAWFDLVNPAAGEETALEHTLGVDVPTREDMEEIEVSSRLFMENGVAFMTATILANTEGDQPVAAPVSFVLMADRLITVRHAEPRAFQIFPQRAEKVAMGCNDGETILVALLEAIVDRLADILEKIGREIDQTSNSIFTQADPSFARARDFRPTLQAIGRKGELTTKVQDSLMTLQRLFGYFAHVAEQRKRDRELKASIKTLARDASSLADYAASLSQKITFLLDATLGMITIQQNATIKIFSVVAVVLMPPTMIASIYGMNFRNMPELNWPWAYPVALLVMVLAAVLPYVFFKRRGWL